MNPEAFAIRILRAFFIPMPLYLLVQKDVLSLAHIKVLDAHAFLNT